MPKPDRDLTQGENMLATKLDQKLIEKIDTVLLLYARNNWLKVAMLVGLTMMNLKKLTGIPDVFYAQRVRKLVREGRLESQGNLQPMCLSEVRLPLLTGNKTNNTCHKLHHTY